MHEKIGFEYITRIGIDKDDPSLRKQSAYKITLSNEMIIIFEKLDKQIDTGISTTKIMNLNVLNWYMTKLIRATQI